MDEFKETVASLGSKKAVDIYGLSKEHFTYMTEDVAKIMLNLINELLSNLNEYSSTLLSTSLASQLWKGKSRPKWLPNSYRRVQSQNFIQKIIQKWLVIQQGRMVWSKRNPNQYGFSESISFHQCSVFRDLLINIAEATRTTLITTSSDLAAAFSKTDRQCQIYECWAQGLTGAPLKFLIQFLTNTLTVFKTDAGFSKLLEERIGSAQGAIYSSHNYLSYCIALWRLLKEAGVGIRVGPVTGEYFLVADDGNTAAKNKEDYIAASKIYEHFSRVYSAVFEFSKTQTNIYGISNYKDTIKGMTFGGYPVKISESSIQLGLKVMQKVRD